VETGNIQQITEAVIQLADQRDKAIAMGKAGREFVRERWDWHNMVSILEADYEKLLAQSESGD